MKKTTVKRIITGILAVTTIASSALLFAGCGEKSPEEKAKDAISDMYNSYKNSSEESSEEKEKETVELNLLDKIVSDKLYTLKINKDNQCFYIRLNDTIDVDGYTVELRNEEKTEEYDSGWKEWDIKKDGKKLASFSMSRDKQDNDIINSNKITVSISAGTPTSEENSEVDFKFTEAERRYIEIDVPAALTPDECKQHMDEIKAKAWDEFENNMNGLENANPKLDGVYYFQGNYDFFYSDNAGKVHMVFDFALNLDKGAKTLSLGPSNEKLVTVNPFILDGEVFFLDSYIANMFADIDFSQGTKIG